MRMERIAIGVILPPMDRCRGPNLVYVYSGRSFASDRDQAYKKGAPTQGEEVEYYERVHIY